MNPTAKIRFLIISNLVTLAIIGTFAVQKYSAKQKEIDQKKVEAAKPYHFTDNGQYVEQVDFFSIFQHKANIVFLGDSHFFRIHWNELLNRNDVANRGIGSDITEGYLARMESVLNTEPKIVFIEGGGNDLDYNVPLDTIVNNIKNISFILKKQNVKPVLNTVFLASKDYPQNDSNKYNKRIDSLNIKIHQLARAENLAIIDINWQLIEAGYLKSQYARKDGIHLTSKAYLIWKSAIESILLQQGI